MTDLEIPKFKTEAEEAQWWYDNRSAVSEKFQAAAREGRLKRGGVRQLFLERGVVLPESKPLPTTTIRLAPEDISKAREQAAKRGLRYQTYLKMIIHEALLKADAAG